MMRKCQRKKRMEQTNFFGPIRSPRKNYNLAKSRPVRWASRPDGREGLPIEGISVPFLG